MNINEVKARMSELSKEKSELQTKITRCEVELEAATEKMEKVRSELVNTYGYPEDMSMDDINSEIERLEKEILSMESEIKLSDID